MMKWRERGIESLGLIWKTLQRGKGGIACLGAEKLCLENYWGGEGGDPCIFSWTLKAAPFKNGGFYFW